MALYRAGQGGGVSWAFHPRRPIPRRVPSSRAGSVRPSHRIAFYAKVAISAFLVGERRFISDQSGYEPPLVGNMPNPHSVM